MGRRPEERRVVVLSNSPLAATASCLGPSSPGAECRCGVWGKPSMERPHPSGEVENSGTDCTELMLLRLSNSGAAATRASPGTRARTLPRR